MDMGSDLNRQGKAQGLGSEGGWEQKSIAPRFPIPQNILLGLVSKTETLTDDGSFFDAPQIRSAEASKGQCV
jgi:hypothetical protein